MNISQLAFRYRPVVAMLTVVLMAYGVFSYFTLPAREDPEITIREAVVTTRFPGLSVERMERLITKTLEEAIRQVPEVDEIRSTSMPGVSIIHAEVYDRYFDLDQIWDNLREKVEAARAELPEGTGVPVVNDDFGDVAVVTAALTAADFSMAEKFDLAKHIRDTLYAVEGTKRIDLLGVQAERIYIETENARLAELGLDPDYLISTLRQQNVIQPGGEIDTLGRNFIIEPSGNFDSVEAIRETLIRLPQTGEVIALRDVARITRTTVDPPTQKAFYNGQPAIVFSIAMLSGYSVLDYGARLKAALSEIEPTLPVGYDLELITYQAEQVASAVYGVTINVLQTLAIVLAMVILFLGLRTGLIVGSIVPAVMLVTLGIMGFIELTLERMSLATLVIALGLLVDNGIVIAEDFKRRLEEGSDRDQALRETGGELALPLLSSTLTTILVFLPLMLAEHVSGEYTRSISLVVLITLLTSWLLALTVTPLLCHRFIKVDATGGGDSSKAPLTQRLFEVMNSGYERILRGVLRVRWLFLTLMFGLLIAAAIGINNAPNQFFPNSDRPQVLVYLDLPAGSSTRATAEQMTAIFEALNDPERFPEIGDYAGYVGFGGPRFVLSLAPIDPAPNKGFIVINVASYAQVEPTIEALRRLFRETFPALSARVTGMFLGPSDSTKIEVQVKGPDAEVVYQTAAAVKAELAVLPGALDLYHDWENRISTIAVKVDQARARRAGVTSADVARSMAAFFSGRQVSEFREGDDVFPIIARAEDSERSDLGRIKSLSVYAQGSNTNIPLLAVADFELRNEFSRIARENLVRTVTVEARNTRMTAEDMVSLIQPALDRLQADLPPGHSIEFDGVVAQSGEAQAALATNVPLCIAAILVLLVAQFNSYKRPLIIVMTIPLVLIGAVIGIYALRANFGFMPILGLYSLAGIIINNAIVLIDRIDIERHTGDHSDFEAVISASVRRLRPIVMTTVTTVLGLMPLIVFQDALFFGLASVMAFGLLVGTLLTLGVVPVLYTLFFGIRPGEVTIDRNSNDKQSDELVNA